MFLGFIFILFSIILFVMIQPKIIKITIKSKIKTKSIKDTKIKIRTKPIKLRQENLVFFFLRKFKPSMIGKTLKPVLHNSLLTCPVKDPMTQMIHHVT
jgi:hypothetical protein